MISDKQLENCQNALHSTGPTTVEGVDAAKLNALRHALRSVQTVVAGEDPDAWAKPDSNLKCGDCDETMEAVECQEGKPV
jgi:hypothetical protein